MFWSSLLGDSRKFVASSSKVLETQWNSLRLKSVLSTFYSESEVKKHLEKKDFENAWKVSRFFAFFLDAFLVHLQYLAEIFETVIKSYSCVLLLKLLCSFVSLICSSFECITKHLCLFPRKTVSFVFPRVLMFPSTSSRETSRLSGKKKKKNTVSRGTRH